MKAFTIRPKCTNGYKTKELKEKEHSAETTSILVRNRNILKKWQVSTGILLDTNICKTVKEAKKIMLMS